MHTISGVGISRIAGYEGTAASWLVPVVARTRASGRSEKADLQLCDAIGRDRPSTAFGWVSLNVRCLHSTFSVILFTAVKDRLRPHQFREKLSI